MFRQDRRTQNSAKTWMPRNSLIATRVKKSSSGHTSLMTVALSFALESLPENIVFFAIVEQRRETTGDERGDWSMPVKGTLLYSSCDVGHQHQESEHSSTSRCPRTQTRSSNTDQRAGPQTLSSTVVLFEPEGSHDQRVASEMDKTA